LLTINCQLVPNSRTSRGSLVDTEIAGEIYSQAARHGAPNALARILVSAGIPDGPVEVRYKGLAGVITYRSGATKDCCDFFEACPASSAVSWRRGRLGPVVLDLG